MKNNIDKKEYNKPLLSLITFDVTDTLTISLVDNDKSISEWNVNDPGWKEKN